MSAYVVERPRLDARMMNLGFSYASPVHSQPAHAYATMSRSPKRKLPDSPIRKSVLHNYLKSLNSMTRSIVLETETVEEEHRKNWTSMNETKREEVVNDHFIPSGVRDQYDCRNWRRPPPMVLKTSGDSSRLHLSQPSSWAEWNEYQDSQDDLVLRNHVASWTNNDVSLPQPSCEPQSQPATFNEDHRLHNKRQLSFRPHNAVNRPPPLPQPRVLPRESLGSDGESPRTSDEDSCVNPLGFHRSKLRSYSMRPKRGNARNNHLRSSARSTHTVHRPTSPDSNRKAYLEERSRPSHYVNLQSFRQDFDVEVDLPDDSLLLDHVHEPVNETTMRQPPQRPLRYSARGRRTFIDQSSTDETDALLSNSEKEPESTTSFSTNSSDSMLITSDECSNAEVICNRFPMSPSHESLDFDDVISNISASQSVMSKDDELRVSTPDSMLSGSSCSYRSKSKYADIAIMRNPRGKRGGSSYKMTTSNYTDRHTQFKPNMLRKQKLNSVQNSPAIRSTPVPQEGMEEDCLSRSFLKPPALVLPHSKYGSVTESETTDLPSSPDQLSEICSPFIQTGLVPENKRESGYLSTASSCESFAIRR